MLGTKKGEKSSFSLSCPAQSFPPPSFRLVIIVSCKTVKWFCHSQHSKLMYVNSNGIVSEPIGGSIPKFSSETDGSKLLRSAMTSISLDCPAQAFPVPSYR